MIQETLFALVLVLSIATPAHSEDHVVTIEQPRNLTKVPLRACVSGTLSNPSDEIVAVVHPTEISAYFVQPAITKDGTKYQVQIFVGERGLHSGQHFEIQVFGNPSQRLKEGMQLDYWPTAEFASSVVEVSRDDSAGSGCAEAGLFSFATVKKQLSGVPDKPSRPVEAPNVSPDPSASFPVLDEVKSALRSLVSTAAFLIVVLFVVMVLLPHRARAAEKRLGEMVETFRDWLVTVAQQFMHTLINLWRWLFQRCRTWVPPIWEARGYEGNLRHLAIAVLLMPVLLLFSVLALYADAKTMITGLNIVFRVETQQATGTLAGLSALEEIRPPTDSTPQNEALRQQSCGSHLVACVADSFQKLWTDEKLGFLAIGLAGLQAVFGLLLFWRLSGDEPLKRRLLGHFRERPILTWCFFIFNIALCALAANRGLEVSPDSVNWALPCIVAAAIALVMPWIMTFTLHYFFECAGDCLSLIKAFALIGLLLASLLLTLSAWIIASLLVLMLIGCALVFFFTFRLVAGAFLLYADSVGELIARFPRFRLVEMRPTTREAVAVALGCLVLLGGIFLIRGVL